MKKKKGGVEWQGRVQIEVILKPKSKLGENKAKLQYYFSPNKFNSVLAPKKGKNLKFKNKNKIKIEKKKNQAIKKLSPLPSNKY